MKKQTGIWIDNHKAVIVSLIDGKDQLMQIESNIENEMYQKKEGTKGSFAGGHHANSESKFGERKKNQIDNFLKDVVQNVKDADELYILGPAETKRRLNQQLQNKLSRDIDKIKSIESANHMTESQLIAKVKQFYQIGNFGPQRNFKLAPPTRLRH